VICQTTSAQTKVHFTLRKHIDKIMGYWILSKMQEMKSTT